MVTLSSMVDAASTDIGVGEAAVDALLGYGVVFLGLVMLMCVIMIVGKIMSSHTKTAEPAPAKAAAAPTPAPAPKAPPAPGSAGEVKLYDTSDKDAAIIMAIVADKMGKPVNELRFISIREVK